ncbi:MAG: malto-oligosyltrehalose trehalohydrolase [Alphaproteobacteria bacterium]|nr:malto-oligosyltrehalose trehalohydrolase [Alphaproteobacteria bacterium]MCW5744324.1 malto-oligosyltrehalose trehalohydrolase [Alphaproteobacteria bacterium]
MIHARQLPFGATLVDADRVRFRLWAPRQRRVEVLLGDDASVAMRRDAGGWFEAEARCGPGARYRYRLGSGETIADPASRAQLGGVHGESVVVDPVSYTWRHADWRGRPWHEVVLYELHPGLFGGFEGIQAELKRLAGLGITAIELMPVADFPGTRNWGYDGVLQFAPACCYGTPEDLKTMIDAAHGLGLMVFLDVVYNHFGPDGNCIAACAPSFFRDDIATPWGAAIDFRRPEVRRFFTENALMWLMEYRFDGLRFDAVHAIAEQDWLVEMAREVRATVEPGRHVHLVLENDANSAGLLRPDAFDAQWNDDAHHAIHVLLTGETDGYYVDHAQHPADRLARCLAEGFDYQGEASAHRGGRKRGDISADLPPTAFVFFLQNHDQVGNRPFGDRLTTLVEGETLRAAVTLQLLCPQIPLIFMGEELGSTVPFQFFTDHRGELAVAVREGRRREFAAFTRFGDGEIPDPNDPQTFERCRLGNEPPSAEWVDFYRQILALRRQAIVPRLAGMTSLGAATLSATAVLARWRGRAGEVLTIAANLGGEPCVLPTIAGDLLFASRANSEHGHLAARCTVAFLQT